MDSYILFGPPGAGKGSVAERIVATYPQFVHVATGQLLRDIKKTDSPDARIMQELDRKGELFPDELIAHVLQNYLKTLPAGTAVLWDGFPRTQEQAKYLDTFSTVMAVYTFTHVSAEEINRRIDKRALAIAAAGLPPRPEDLPGAREKRMQEYNEKTLPVLDYYRGRVPIVTIDARPSIDAVAAQILQDLKQRI